MRTDERWGQSHLFYFIFFQSVSTLGGNLSMCLRNMLTCQISLSLSMPPKAGMPVNLMPWATLKYVYPSGSSVTVSPLPNRVGPGMNPLANAGVGFFGAPWQ